MVGFKTVCRVPDITKVLCYMSYCSCLLIRSSVYDLLEDRRIGEVINYFFSLLYFVKQIDSRLACASSIIDHRCRQNVLRKLMTPSPNGSCAEFLF